MRSSNNRLAWTGLLAGVFLTLVDVPTCHAQTSGPPQKSDREVDGAAQAGHRKAGEAISGDAQREITLQSKAEQAAEGRIHSRLETEVEGHFTDMPLGDVLKQLSQATGIPIRIDTRALEDASIAEDVPMTLDLPPVSLESGLTLLLDPLDLTWIIKDEVLLVTTPEKASNELMTKVYPALDLVNYISSSGQFELVDTVTSTLAPITWDEVGGPGSIQVFRASGALVVSQTGPVHRQIAALLTALREARDRQGIPRTMSVAEPLQKMPQRGFASGPTPLIPGDQPAAGKAVPASK